MAANIPGFPVLPEGPFVAAARQDAGVPAAGDPFAQLYDGKGQRVPSKFVPIAGSTQEDVLLAPTAPLTPGPYELRRPPSTCPGLGSPSPEITRFQVGPSQPALPKLAGTVEVSPAVRRRLRVGAGTLCSEPADAVVRELKIVPTAEMAGFLPIAKLSVKIDGKDYGETAWGGTVRFVPAAEVPGVPESAQIIFLPVDATTLHTVCGPTASPQTNKGLAEGPHTGEVTVTIPNVGSLPPVAFQFEMSCAGADGGAPDGGVDLASRPDSSPGTDAAVSDGGAGQPPALDSGANVDVSAVDVRPAVDVSLAIDAEIPLGPTPARDPDESDGCTMGRARPSGGLLLVSLLGAVGLLLGKRRRGI